MPKGPTPLPAAIRVARRMRVNLVTGCWEWLGADNGKGYGITGAEGRRGSVYVHRVMYEELREQIPDGMVLDHLCRNRRCCNPWHVEPVTRGDNVRIGEHPNFVAMRTNICKRGHSLADAYRRPNGTRACRVCMRLREAAYRRARGIPERRIGLRP